ncbi:unnamed protein product [[Candida] boidinii]|uniref:Unnamed protein product n=1 Tax=Candida boidinii TaxID=5477 RepID=A0A9W6WFT8_CANBO|nr:hypothetical protein B5S30_g3998 [[Candida] boidinii]GME69188.1 unnamed protein product [[Candida] boidinii]GMF99190.1 unnamed protein product [[Candida] boidinii]
MSLAKKTKTDLLNIADSLNLTVDKSGFKKDVLDSVTNHFVDNYDLYSDPNNEFHKYAHYYKFGSSSPTKSNKKSSTPTPSTPLKSQIKFDETTIEPEEETINEAAEENESKTNATDEETTEEGTETDISKLNGSPAYLFFKKLFSKATCKCGDEESEGSCKSCGFLSSAASCCCSGPSSIFESISDFIYEKNFQLRLYLSHPFVLTYIICFIEYLLIFSKYFEIVPIKDASFIPSTLKEKLSSSVLSFEIPDVSIFADPHVSYTISTWLLASLIGPFIVSYYINFDIDADIVDFDPFVFTLAKLFFDLVLLKTEITHKDISLELNYQWSSLLDNKFSLSFLFLYAKHELLQSTVNLRSILGSWPLIADLFLCAISYYAQTMYPYGYPWYSAENDYEWDLDSDDEDDEDDDELEGDDEDDEIEYQEEF